MMFWQRLNEIRRDECWQLYPRLIKVVQKITKMQRKNSNYFAMHQFHSAVVLAVGVDVCCISHFAQLLQFTHYKATNGTFFHFIR